jgi:hypothetical protein
MYTGIQSLLVCDPAEQPVQLLPLVDIEGGANGVIMFACNTPNLFGHISARSSEVQRVGPPVCRILAAFNQASFLEFIQKRNELAWQDGQAAAKLLLAQPGGESDQPENARVRTVQAQACQSFTELGRGVCSYLRQQERR